MFDRKEYKQNILFLLDKAYEEYKTVSFGIPNQQFATLKTYLWLGSIFGAFELAFFSEVTAKETGVIFFDGQISYHFYMFALIALICSVFSFIIAIDALKEKVTQGLPFGDFMELSNLVISDAGNEDEYSFHISILNSLNNEIKIQSKSCDSRGKILKKLSTLQLCALAMTCCSIISLI